MPSIIRLLRAAFVELDLGTRASSREGVGFVLPSSAAAANFAKQKLEHGIKERLLNTT